MHEVWVGSRMPTVVVGVGMFGGFLVQKVTPIQVGKGIWYVVC